MFSEEILSELLTSDLDEMRCIGRLISTGVADLLRDFVQAERERNTHPADVQYAMLRVTAAYMMFLLINTPIGLDYPRETIVKAFDMILESDFERMGKILEQAT